MTKSKLGQILSEHT